MSTVLVTPGQAEQARSDGSVAVVDGTDPENGDVITFGGDLRVTADFLAAVIAGGTSLPADVEPWQVLGRRAESARVQDERELRPGMCGHQVAYGLPWSEYCTEDAALCPHQYPEGDDRNE